MGKAASPRCFPLSPGCFTPQVSSQSLPHDWRFEMYLLRDINLSGSPNSAYCQRRLLLEYGSCST